MDGSQTETSLRQLLRAVEEAEVVRKRTAAQAADELKISNNAADNVLHTANGKANNFDKRVTTAREEAHDALDSVDFSKNLNDSLSRPNVDDVNNPAAHLEYCVEEVEQKSKKIIETTSELQNWRSRQQQKRYTIVSVGLVVFVLLIVGVFLGVRFLMRELPYRAAVAALDAGEWDTARAELSRLQEVDPKYKDASDLQKEIPYRAAVTALDAGDYETASLELLALSEMDSEFKDSRALRQKIDLFIVGDTRTRSADNMTMVYVPAGTFPMGSENGADDEQPVHDVILDAFWIDQTEVTNAQFGLCIDAGACSVSISGIADHPVVNVTWNDAHDYCEWIGGYLPTEAQWEYAARGAEGNIYPWGNEPPDCHLAKYRGCGLGTTAPVGNYPDGASWTGAMDMAGNVWEWVRDWYYADYYAISTTTNPQGPDNGQSKVLRGGGWDSFADGIRAAFRFNSDPADANGSAGLRCAQE